MPQSNTGVRGISAGEGVASFAQGFLQRFLADRDQRAAQTRQDQLIAGQREFQTGQNDIARQQQLSDAEQVRKQQLDDARRNFDQNLISTAASSGMLHKIDPDVLDQYILENKEFLDPQSMTILKEISSGNRQKYEDELKLKRDQLRSKGSSDGKDVTDPQALNFVQDDLGPGYTRDVYRAGASVYKALGIDAYTRWVNGGELPREVDSSGQTMEDNIKKVRLDVQENHSGEDAALRKMGVNMNIIYSSMVKENLGGKGWDWDTSKRRGIADTVAGEFTNDPNTPVDVDKINAVLGSMEGFNKIGTPESNSITAVLDDIIRFNEAQLFKSRGGVIEELRNILKQATQAPEAQPWNPVEKGAKAFAGVVGNIGIPSSAKASVSQSTIDSYQRSRAENR